MGLSKVMMAALAQAEYLEPTPIQAGMIPRALAGIDLMGQAQTGTGKTAAFCIPILERLQPRRKRASPQALILVPTRELAVQVRDECVKLSAGRDAARGGHLRRQADPSAGRTPSPGGRDRRGHARPGDGPDGPRFAASWATSAWWSSTRPTGCSTSVFGPTSRRFCDAARNRGRRCCSSATIPPPVKRLAERYMREPEMIDFSTKDLAVETIQQSYFTVDPERKFDLLVKLLQREEPQQAIVFCRTKRGTDKVCRRLTEMFKGVDTIHGDLQQSARDRVMRRFREGKIKVLVATDVVGRGIDVTTISHIINYDVPQFCDDYVHRVGRTGRMGREGVAFTFITPEEGNELTRIEMRINRLLKRDEIPGFVALAKPLPNEEFDAESGEPRSRPRRNPSSAAARGGLRRAL